MGHFANWGNYGIRSTVNEAAASCSTPVINLGQGFLYVSPHSSSKKERSTDILDM